MLHAITVRVKSLRHLPQQFFHEEKEKEQALKAAADRRKGAGIGTQRRCFRAQANISDESRETGNSVWGKGTRSREVQWLRGADTMMWKLPEHHFKRMKAYSPVLKVYVLVTHANSPVMESSDSLGWFTVDMRDLAGQRLQNERWVKLQGASPAEVLISSTLAIVPEHEHEQDDSKDYPSKAQSSAFSPSPRSPRPERQSPTAFGERLANSPPVKPPAAPLPAATDTISELESLPVGKGADGPDARTFSLSISVKGAGRLAQLAPHLDGVGGGFWFSYSIFGVVVQTNRFECLTPPSGDGLLLEPMMDSFRLRATLSGLCHFLSDAPPLQVYLCTERRILAHADVDMSLLLPRRDWEGRMISDFGRTGMDGDFQLRRPGETPLELGTRDDRDQLPIGCAVVRISARLSIIESAGDESSADWTESVAETSGSSVQQVDRHGLDRGTHEQQLVGGGLKVRAWSRTTPKSPEVSRRVITATLQRLDLKPLGIAEESLRGQDAVGRPCNAILVGIERQRDWGEQGKGGEGEEGAESEGGKGGCAHPVASSQNLEMVRCSHNGEIVTEDPSILSGIRWRWEGTPPPQQQQQQSQGERNENLGKIPRSAARGANVLAYVQVMGFGLRREELALGEVPWPLLSSEECSQQMDVKLRTRDGTEVGRCSVCLDVRASQVTGERVDESNLEEMESTRAPAALMSGSTKGTQEDEEMVEETKQLASAETKMETTPSAEADKGAERTCGVDEVLEVPERPLGGDLDPATRRLPHRYRLSINLASIKDLENAAFVLACYHYPYFGTSAPVRTSSVWVPPRSDTPLANACCTFSFGMSFDRLTATLQDHPLIVSIRNKDRFTEEEMGLVTLPLIDLVKSSPRFFRCQDTNKFSHEKTYDVQVYHGFRAHLKFMQRAGQPFTSPVARATPVEVRVLDSYLTVASMETTTSNLPRSDDRSRPSKPSLQAPVMQRFRCTGMPLIPERSCSVRVILLLEDMGPSGGPSEEIEELHGVSAAAAASATPTCAPHELPNETSVPPSQQDWTASLPRVGVGGNDGIGNIARPLPPAMPSPLKSLARRADGGMNLERVWVEWEQWRTQEEAAFAQRLREKDEALEQKLAARESVRRKDLAQAQTDYGKLEGKLRKALSEVEARERALKAREESWRADHAHKLSELQLLQRRLRDETKHQVELERMKVKSLEKQVASHGKALEDARARAMTADEDLERLRQQHRRSPEGSLRQEVFRLGAAKAEAEAKVERERSEKHKALLEKEEYRAHIHKLARALKRHQERESTCARREMEQLRLEYLAREERFMLDGDRNELRTIKQELDELRHLSLVQEAKAELSTPDTAVNKARSQPGAPRQAREAPDEHFDVLPEPGPSPNPPPQPTPAPAPTQVSSHRGSSLSSEGYVRSSDGGKTQPGLGEEECLWRLTEWRDDLLATGMYTASNPIVSELNRRILQARGALVEPKEGLRGQE